MTEKTPQCPYIYVEGFTECVYLLSNNKDCEEIDACPGNGDAWCYKEESTEEIFVNAEFYVAGLQFHQYEQAKHEIGVDWILDLVPDPQNKYDPDFDEETGIGNAVRIECGGIMLGFVPAKTGEARLIAQALRNGMELTALVTKHDLEAKVTWGRLKVWVRETTRM